jgi:hypothetical protein
MFTKKLFQTASRFTDFITLLGRYHDEAKTFGIAPLSPGKRIIALSRAMGFDNHHALSQHEKANKDATTLARIRIPVIVVMVNDRLSDDNIHTTTYLCHDWRSVDDQKKTIFELYAQGQDMTFMELCEEFDLPNEDEPVKDMQEDEAELIAYLINHRSGNELCEALARLMYNTVSVTEREHYLERDIVPADLI